MLAAAAAKFSPATLSAAWIGVALATDTAAVAKFRAPTLARWVAFDVGRHQFSAALKLEGLVAALTSATSWARTGTVSAALGVALVALVAQAFVLFPRLDARAQAFIAAAGDATKAPRDGARVHAVYLLVEAVKLIALALV
jgi:hypothetical protein